MKVSYEIFEKINNGIVKYPDNSTNKKCPICGNDIIYVPAGTSYSLECKTKDCIHFDYRGI